MKIKIDEFNFKKFL